MLSVYASIGTSFTTICQIYPRSLACRILKLHPSVREITHLSNLTIRSSRAFTAQMACEALERSVNVEGLRAGR